MASLDETTKKRIILSIISFLQKEADQSDPDKKESVEVAIQCLESAFNIEYNRDKLDFGDVPNLTEFFIHNISPLTIAEAEDYKNKGNVQMRNGNYKEAVDEYSKAINLNPSNAVYFCNRAAAYNRLEQHENSIADCEQAVKLDPNYAKAYSRLGIAYSALNRFAEASDSYRKALTIDPGNAMYEENLKLAEERLTAPPGEQNPDFGQFISNPNLLNMASQMLNDPSVRNIMSGLLNIGTEGSSPNVDALLQMGQQLAQQMQINNPSFVDNLRRQFSGFPQEDQEEGENPNPPSGNDERGDDPPGPDSSGNPTAP